MIPHEVKVHPASSPLPREEQFAWKLASLATLPAIDADTAAMVAARIIDNAAVALAAINRGPVAAARAMALANPRAGGATLIGLPAATTVGAEWAAWANATAVRELDFHDTFLAADYAHRSRPGAAAPLSRAPSPSPTRSMSRWSRRSRCIASRRTTSPISPRRRWSASAACSA